MDKVDSWIVKYSNLNFADFQKHQSLKVLSKNFNGLKNHETFVKNGYIANLWSTDSAVFTCVTSPLALIQQGASETAP